MTSAEPDVMEIARNMAQSPDNWPPMRVKQVAEALLAASAPASAPTVDEIIVWFNAWLKEPVSERERVIISHTVDHALKFPADVKRANEAGG